MQKTFAWDNGGMGERIKTYRQRIDDLLARGDLTRDQWQQVLDEHVQQIAFFSHERLVHLIVTMTVAVLLMMSFGILIVSQYLPFAAVCGLLTVLFVPYIVHYMTLENEVQKMYGQYDLLLGRARSER